MSDPNYSQWTFYCVVVGPVVVGLLLFAKAFGHYLVMRRKYPEIFQRQGTYRFRDLFAKMWREL